MDGSGQGPSGPDQGGNSRSRGAGPEPNLSGLAGIGVQFIVAILLFLFLGKWLDGRLGTAPWLMIVGVFVGAGASMYAMYRKIFPSEPPKQPPAGKEPPR